MERPDAVLIAGPTASGKSRLAVQLAERLGGVVINADSMQVYAGLQILTARPLPREEGGVEHRLFGHVDPRSTYSVGAWIREVEALLPRIRASGRIPVFCGGTGMYFKALTDGLTDAPAVDPDLRATLRALMAAEGPGILHRALQAVDPVAAARIRPSDPQRIVRALELAELGREVGTEAENLVGPLTTSETMRIVLAPERAGLREAIAVRFQVMVEAGAMAEAAAFADRFGDVETLASKAIGLAELAAACRGEITLAQAVERAVTRSRQYAKRQETWFRNQLGGDWQRFVSAEEALIAGTSGRSRG